MQTATWKVCCHSFARLVSCSECEPSRWGWDEDEESCIIGLVPVMRGENKMTIDCTLHEPTQFTNVRWGWWRSGNGARFQRKVMMKVYSHDLQHPHQVRVFRWWNSMPSRVISRIVLIFAWKARCSCIRNQWVEALIGFMRGCIDKSIEVPRTSSGFPGKLNFRRQDRNIKLSLLATATSLQN